MVTYIGFEILYPETETSFPAKWLDDPQEITFAIHHKPPNGEIDKVRILRDEDEAEQFWITEDEEEWSECTLEDAIELWKEKLDEMTEEQKIFSKAFIPDKKLESP